MNEARTERLLRALLDVHAEFHTEFHTEVQRGVQRGVQRQVSPGEAATDLHPAERAYARLLVAARRLDAAEGGCPDGARHRARALFDSLPETLWETATRLVFDSWRQAAPTARSLGGDRLLRFENGAAALDVQVDTVDAADGLATVALAVEGGGEALQAQLILRGGAKQAVALDGHGTGSVRIDGAGLSFAVLVRDEDGELLLTPAVLLA